MLNLIRTLVLMLDQWLLDCWAALTGTPDVPQYVRYQHHGKIAWTRSDLLGTHRQNCLCWSCSKLFPGSKDNCPIAQKLYGLCVEHNLVTPVYECPDFTKS
jgi:hypothetical protein